MTRDEAVLVIRRGLTYRGSTSADNIIEALKEGQRIREQGKTLPWFLLDEDYEWTGTADSSVVQLPSDFLRVSEDFKLSYYNSDGDFQWELERGDGSQLARVWRDSTKIIPYAYALRHSTIEVFPTPTAAWSLIGDIYRKDTVLTTNIENEWLANAPDVLIAEAGLIVAGDLHDDEAAKKWVGKLARASNALLSQIVDRETAGAVVAMGENN